MQGGLGGVVHAAEYIGHDARQAADHDDCSPRFDEQRCKGLTQPHDAEHVGLKDIADPRQLYVEGWDGVVDAGVVDQVVEAAAVEE